VLFRSGSFVIRARLPAGYKVPPHSHPTAEQLTVLSGDLGVGLGDRFDEAKGQELKPGGFADLPGKMNHYVWTKNGAVIQVQGQSPFEITYANPAEDPRKQ
jgi:anti-sigma factor ChrR (cupin superfamily)